MALGGSSRTISLHVRTTEDGRGLLESARDLERMADGVERTNSRMGHFGDETRHVNDEVKRLRTEVQNFGRAWATTGDDVDRQAYASAKRRLASMQRLAKDLMPERRGTLASWGAAYGIDFSQIASEARGGVIAGAIGLGVIMAPVLAGTLAAAVTGVFASGTVIGGGILAGLKSTEVQRAWKSLGHDVMAQLDPVTDVFEQPMIRAAERFRGAFERARIVPTLEKAAKLADPLTEGLASTIESLGPGLETTAERGLPAVKALGAGLTDVGEGISAMLDDFADAGDRAAVAFRDSFHILGLIEAEVGNTFEGLSDIYALTRSPLLKGWLGFDAVDVIPWSGLLGLIGKIGDTSHEASGFTRLLGNEFFESAEKAKEYARAVEAANKVNQDYFQTAMSLDRANQSVADSWVALCESLNEYNNQWDMFSKGGSANRQRIMDVVDAFERQRQAAIEAGHGTAEATQKANDAFDAQIRALDELAKDRHVPKPIRQDLILSYLIEFRVESYISQGAQLLLSMVGKSLSAFTAPGFGGGGSTPSSSAGGNSWSAAREAWSHGGAFPGFASGGMAPANVPVVIGEHSPMGPQMTMFRRPTYIMPGGGGSSGGGGQVIELAITGGDSAVQAFLGDFMRRFVKAKGGGNVQVALGSNSR